MKTHLVPLFASLFVTASAANAANLVTNPGFEAGTADWGIFAPAVSNPDSNPVFSVVATGARTGKNAALLSSENPGRFSLVNKLLKVPAKPQERYRVVVWYRGQPGATVKGGSPGAVIRVDFANTDPDQPAPKVPMLFLNAKGATAGAIKTLCVSATGPVNQEWTKLEFVFEVPSGANRFTFGLFAWGTTGGILVDDYECEKVSDATPLTPLN